MSRETKQFQTEVKQILDLMIHSLYSQREIFLRELISNASDALDKLRFLETSDTSLQTGSGTRQIRLIPNAAEKTLTIVDNGVGMSYAEVEKNIGTIAYSGSKEFLQKAQKLKEQPELIGQFGVGFYSAFMVADKVTLHTQKAGESAGTLWQSSGDGSYEIESMPRSEGHGTSICLHLKDFSASAGDAAGDEEKTDFCNEWTLRSLVKKYSDFISYPIVMKVTREEPVSDEKGEKVEGKTTTVEKDETLNSQKALWLRSPKDVSEAEYHEFYKHFASDWENPLETIHYRAEGSQEFSALLYVPTRVPYDYNYREIKYGLSLYVKKVFILDNCEKLIPPYLRFLKGVVDSSDLSLNVSREMLQQDRQVGAIKKALVSKVLRSLATMLEKNRENYEKFWKNFGATLKEGIPSDHGNKEAIMGLSLFHSSRNESTLITLQEYVDKMSTEQKDIYFMTGESLAQLQASPHMERVREKNFDVLFLIDPVDEWVMNAVTEFSGKKLVSVARGDLDLDSESEKKTKEEQHKEQEERFKPLTEAMAKILADAVKEVKISDRLVDSPVCLVSGNDAPSAHMERIMAAMGQDMPKSKRILEINPNHPIFNKMLAFSEEKKSSWTELLYNQALLNEGSPIKDPAKFSKQITELMVNI
jgi:molecular chaperone HtpG